jgi:hypothetical protein
MTIGATDHDGLLRLPLEICENFRAHNASTTHEELDAVLRTGAPPKPAATIWNPDTTIQGAARGQRRCPRTGSSSDPSARSGSR